MVCRKLNDTLIEGLSDEERSKICVSGEWGVAIEKGNFKSKNPIPANEGPALKKSETSHLDPLAIARKPYGMPKSGPKIILCCIISKTSLRQFCGPEISLYLA